VIRVRDALEAPEDAIPAMEDAEENFNVEEGETEAMEERSDLPESV